VVVDQDGKKGEREKVDESACPKKHHRAVQDFFNLPSTMSVYAANDQERL